MRTLNPSLALASLVGFLTAASCTLITDVDRTKIPTDAGAEAGSPGSGGTTETGGTGGTAGTGGTKQTGGTAGMGEGGQATGGTGGNAGETTGGTGGTGEMGGTGGSAGAAPVVPVCDHATGTITIEQDTNFGENDTLVIGDGVHPAVVFEFVFQNDVTAGHVKISLTGNDQFVNAGLITDAINAQERAGALLVKATFVEAAPVDNGEGGAAGASGATGSSGNGSGGIAAAPDPTAPAHINLMDDLAGALGNVKINRSKTTGIGHGVGSPNFKTTGMSGGEAVECASAASCKTGDECASGECGDDNMCVPQ